jgi:hypothetical protein
MAEVWEVYQQRQRDWLGARTLRPSSFPDLGEALDQVTFVPGTSLLVATRTPWTAVYYHPAEPVVFSWGLANYIPCAWATVELGASDVPGGGEDRQFMYHRVPRNRDEIVNSPKYCQRLVSLTRENNRWSFYQSGEPLPFEQLKAYTKSRRSDRLTTQMLLDYAAELGIPIDDMGAYAGETLLVYRPEFDKYPGLSRTRKEERDFDELCLKRIEERLDA